MKLDLLDNGSVVTITRVFYKRGIGRARIMVEIKEKYHTKLASLGQSKNSLVVSFIETDKPTTTLVCVPENDFERRMLSDWTLLEDYGKRELRLWFVHQLDDDEDEQLLYYNEKLLEFPYCLARDKNLERCRLLVDHEGDCRFHGSEVSV